MAVLTFLMQLLIIGANANNSHKQYKGIWTLFWSAFALMLHYLLLLLNTAGLINLNAAWGQGVRELFNVIGHALIYVSVCQFLEISFNRTLLFGLVPLVMLTGFIPNPPIVRPLALSILVILDAVSVLALWRVKNESYAHGARLTAIPLMIYAVITMIRMVIIINDLPVQAGQPDTAKQIQGLFEMFALFVSSFLWTSAFIFMISQRLQSDLNELAMKDVLTRVRNRRAMQGLLNFEMRRVQKDVQEFSIILLDIDHFKSFNDTYGHDVGDLVLQWMAQTMQAALRAPDIVSRWGGEEFLVLLPATGLDEALQVAERLRQTIELSALTRPDGQPPLHVTFSGGVACSHNSENVDALCKAADQALYRAKQTRNRVLPEALSAGQETSA